MMELPGKMKNWPNKYVIMQQDDVIKRFWSKYVQQNWCQMGEYTVTAVIYMITSIPKIG